MGPEEVKDRLKELGLSIRGMSRVLGVPRRALKRVLRGESADPVLRAAVAAALKVPVSALPGPSRASGPKGRGRGNSKKEVRR